MSYFHISQEDDIVPSSHYLQLNKYLWPQFLHNADIPQVWTTHLVPGPAGVVFMTYLDHCLRPWWQSSSVICLWYYRTSHFKAGTPAALRWGWRLFQRMQLLGLVVDSQETHSHTLDLGGRDHICVSTSWASWHHIVQTTVNKPCAKMPLRSGTGLEQSPPQWPRCLPTGSHS